jgi:hypothetical protein
VGARQDRFGRFINESQHTVFRIAAVVLSSWSALQVYAIFSSSEANPFVAHVMDVGATISIVAIGYFVLRGLAHRIKEGKPILSYVLLSFLYSIFEVMCNLGAFSSNQTGLTGLHLFLVSLAPFAKSMMPVFASVLAWVDVDLMAERGSLPVAQPKPSPSWVSNARTTTMPSQSSSGSAANAPSPSKQQWQKQAAATQGSSAQAQQQAAYQNGHAPAVAGGAQQNNLGNFYQQQSWR